MSHSHRRPKPPRRGVLTLVRGTRPAVPEQARKPAQPAGGPSLGDVPAARYERLIGQAQQTPPSATDAPLIEPAPSQPAPREPKASKAKLRLAKASTPKASTPKASKPKSTKSKAAKPKPAKPAKAATLERPGQSAGFGAAAAPVAWYAVLAVVLVVVVAGIALGLRAVSGGQAPAVTRTHPLGMSWTVLLSLGGVFVALLAAPLLLFGRLRERDKTRALDSRIGPYVPSASPEEGPGSAVRAVTHLLRYRGTDRKLEDRLDLAALRRKPAEWVMVCASVSVAVMVLLTLFTGNPVLGIVVGGAGGWGGAKLVLNLWISRRRNAFQSQLPDVLELMSGSLQSGLTLARALDAVVSQNLQPISSEFARALSDVRIGAGVEDALETVADRMDSSDLRWAIMAIRIHRSVGGNLVEILQNVMTTMREREYLRRQIKSLSAEGRLSAYVLIALPICIGGWLFYSSPTYMQTMYTTTSGLIMLVGAAVLMVVGALWMRKLIRIEV